MRLSRSEFEAGAQRWLEGRASPDGRHVQSKWTWRSDPIIAYGYLEQLGKPISYPACIDNDAGLQRDVVEECDEAAQDSRLALDRAFVDYYVVYSPSYQVPVLYFRGRDRGSQLKLELLLHSALFGRSSREYPLNTLNEAVDGSGHMPAVSQGEHPVSGLPCYFLHPCETSAALQDILGPAQAVPPHKLMETWMMLVGSVVNVER
ncbi:MAG: hypothetical protein CYPHOPRED_001130 [Cyphobasidiales sp. Tagirdzhanova-0007]|nr:MAG: hypothetical protein CYPHOPRED_001130 [Cyphobasidiales sp. Tagirdzhanova-0007]